MKSRISRKSKRLLALSPIVAGAAMMVAQAAMAHGYVTSPASRVYLCTSGQNGSCQTREPQSMEGSTGKPENAPADLSFATMGIGGYQPLLEQTADRWRKTDINVGENTFTWHFTQVHRTKNFRYYITKNGWNPNKPLTRDQFESKPFCQHDLPAGAYGLGTTPIGGSSGPYSAKCNVPKDHSGYHVILGVWQIGDTSNSFYNVMDVNVKGDSDQPTPPTPVWQEVGTIKPTEDLRSGDKVLTRVFTSKGETPNLSVSYTVANNEDGVKDRWPYLFAKAINQASRGYRAGALNDDGTVKAVTGSNTVFAKSGSDVKGVEFEIDRAKHIDDFTDADLSVTPKASYAINGNEAVIDGTLDAKKQAQVTIELYNKQTNAMVGTQSLKAHGRHSIHFTASPVTAGNYSLVVKAKAAENSAEGFVQKTFDVKLTGGAAIDPEAIIKGPTEIQSGGTLTLDGSQSKGVEIYHWIPKGAAELRDLSGSNFAGPKLIVKMPQVTQDKVYTFQLAVYAQGKRTSTAQSETTARVLLKAQKSDDGKSPSCNPAWATSTAYTGGQKVTWKGRNYEARWWTQGNEPGLPAYTGPEGSGKVWKDLGACK